MLQCHNLPSVHNFFCFCYISPPNITCLINPVSFLICIYCMYFVTLLPQYRCCYSRTPQLFTLEITCSCLQYFLFNTLHYLLISQQKHHDICFVLKILQVHCRYIFSSIHYKQQIGHYSFFLMYVLISANFFLCLAHL